MISITRPSCFKNSLWRISTNELLVNNYNVCNAAILNASKLSRKRERRVILDICMCWALKILVPGELRLSWLKCHYFFFFYLFYERNSERGVCGYVYYMLSHSRNDEINISDDLTQKGSKFQSEHVLGTKECMYALVRQKGT